MGASFLLSALLFWVVSRVVRPDLLIRGRRRSVAAYARDLAHDATKNPELIGRTLAGPGVVRVHAAVSLSDFAGLCGQPVQSLSGADVDDVTCRACVRLMMKAAWDAARSADA